MRTITAVLLLSVPVSAQCLDWSREYALPGADSVVRAAVYHDDGSGERLYVGGAFRQIGRTTVWNVARWDGTAAFEPVGGGVGGVVYRLRVLDDGAGRFLYATLSQPDPHYVYRWDGASWAALPGITGYQDIAAFDDGSGTAIYTAGGNAIQGRVRRWSGSAWELVGPGSFDRPVVALAVFDDGSGPALHAAGSFEYWNDQSVRGLARWTGSAWVEVGGGVNGLLPPGVIALHAVGSRLYVGGQFTTAGGLAAANVAAWDGAGWQALGVGADFAVHALDSYAGPSSAVLLATGGFGLIGGQPTAVGAWDGSTWSALGGRLRGHLPGFSSFGPLGLTIAVPASGPHGIVVGGAFSSAGESAAAQLARFDGITWRAVVEGNALIGDVAASVVHDDGTGKRVYVGGDLDAAGLDAVDLVARFDGEQLERVGRYAQDAGAVRALASADLGTGPRLYAAGTFSTIGGVPASRMATWDGSAWSALANGGANATVEALLHDPAADAHGLYTGGAFTNVGGVAAIGVARFDGASWTQVGAGLAGVSALAFFDDGAGPRLHAAGAFAGRIARFDGLAWSIVPQAPSGGASQVRAMQAFDDGVTRRLFIGGSFQSVGGTTTYNIASFDGTSWTTYGVGASGYLGSSVDAFRVFDDGLGAGAKLFAGGYFAQIDGTVGFSVLAYDGSAWQSAAPGGGVDSVVTALDVLPDAEGSSLHAFGSFRSSNLGRAWGVARYGRHGLAGCDAVTGASFCAGDGSGVACPCGNVGLAGRGCDNAHATGGAELDALGQANLVADDVTLRVRGASPSGTLLFFQGTSTQAGGVGVTFGDGVRCVGGTQVRLAVRTAVAGEARFGAGIPGDPSVSSAGWLAGATNRTYQVWYRDAQTFCTPSTFNLSNGLSIRWGS